MDCGKLINMFIPYLNMYQWYEYTKYVILSKDLKEYAGYPDADAELLFLQSVSGYPVCLRRRRMHSKISRL